MLTKAEEKELKAIKVLALAGKLAVSKTRAYKWLADSKSNDEKKRRNDALQTQIG